MTYGNQSLNNNNDEIEIDLGELFQVFLKNIHYFILTAIVFGVLGYLITSFLITPLYTSTSKIYVISKSEGTALTYSDLQTGNQLTKDYIELTKSRPVLEATIDRLDLELTPNELLGYMNVETPKDTRFLVISVSYPEPDMSKKIVDTLREEVSVKIKDIMYAESVNVVEEGNLPLKPSSPSIIKNTAIAAFLGLMLSMAIVFAKTLLDDTIKTPDDVSKYLGLSVLAAIPEDKLSNQKRRG